ncbi:MAG: biotin/lipoyl-binding protein, partial [bacterium]|nr:biotin/lipoyl-binding protein [bacterium]
MKKYLVIPIIFIFSVFSSCQKIESTVLTLSGTVESKDVRISSLVGGRITEINYDEGDEVKKDSIIAKIDCRDYELQLAQAETVISGAKAKLRLI